MIIFISDKKRKKEIQSTFLVICFKGCIKSVKRQAHIFNISFAWAHLVGHPSPLPAPPSPLPFLIPPTARSFPQSEEIKIKSKNEDKCRIYIFLHLLRILLSKRIWSFTVCYQVTEAWLAPFVCGGLFCPVPYVEDTGGGCVVGEATSTQLYYSLIICRFGLSPRRRRTEAETFEFLLWPRERHYTVCPVYDVLFLSVWFILLFFFFLHADFFGLVTFL